MKKNILLGILSLLLIVSVMFTVLNTQKLGHSLKEETSKTKQLHREVQETKDKNESLTQQVGDLTKLKTGYVIEGMTETVSRFFNDAFTFKADEDSYESRKADAKQIASEAVLNQFFVDEKALGSPTLVDSSVQNIKVYIENTRNTVTSGIVTYTLNNQIGESLDKSSIMYYRFTFDATLNQLLSAERMERFVPES